MDEYVGTITVVYDTQKINSDGVRSAIGAALRAAYLATGCDCYWKDKRNVMQGIRNAYLEVDIYRMFGEPNVLFEHTLETTLGNLLGYDGVGFRRS